MMQIPEVAVRNQDFIGSASKKGWQDRVKRQRKFRLIYEKNALAWFPARGQKNSSVSFG